jgi:hypothetical protein
MPSAPDHPSVSGARADALFASLLQRSGDPSAGQVRQAIATALGARGCAARVAHAYGEHPDTATARMRWALAAAARALPGPQARPARPASARDTVPGTCRAA